MRYEEKYFIPFIFSEGQTLQHLKNAEKDLAIAHKDDILDVKFNYAYTSLIKGGVALLAHNGLKIKSIPGHHATIIDYLARALEEDEINAVGNAMRAKRNIGMYSGGTEITEKECRDYIAFVEKVVAKIKEKLL